MSNLSDADAQALKIWRAKLDDTTLSPAEHAKARTMVDELTGKGPTARVATLERMVRDLSATVLAILTRLDMSYDARLVEAAEPEAAEPEAAEPEAAEPEAAEPEAAEPEKPASNDPWADLGL